MKDEFDSIMSFFTLDSKDKELHLKEVFDDSIAFFERFKYILANGTPEEKKAMVEKVNLLKEKMAEEAKKASENTGLTEEQLQEISNNPNSFSEENWEIIKTAKNKIEEQSSEIAAMAQPKKAPKKTAKRKRKTSKKRDKWIQS